MVCALFHFHFERNIMATAPKKRSNKVKDEAPLPVGTIPFSMQRLEKLLGGASSSVVTISPLKGKTLMTVQSQGSTAESVLSAPLPGLTAAWDFQYAALSAAILNRDNAEFTCTDGQLVIKDKRYNATLQGVESPNTVRVEKPSQPTCDIEVNPEVWSLLEAMTSKVKISKSLAALPDITVHYLFTKKTALAVSFDRFQMAAYFLPNSSGLTFSLTLPLSRAESVFKGNGVTSLLASKELLYVKAGSVSSSSSLPSVEDTTGVPVEAVLGRVKILRDAKFPKSVTLPKEDIQKFLNNSKAISNSNALLKIEVSESKSKLDLSADGNHVTATLPSKSKKNFSFKLDIAYVNTIVSKSAEEIQFEIDDSTLVYRNDSLIYASVLSVDEESEQPASKKKSKDED